jgi:hypothetical protein
MTYKIVRRLALTGWGQCRICSRLVGRQALGQTGGGLHAPGRPSHLSGLAAAASVILRREDAAATRNMANTAKVIAENRC